MEDQAADREAALVRPFLAAPMTIAPSTAATQTPVEAEAAGVRSYAITNGRSRGSIHLEFEAMLQVTPLGANEGRPLQFERGAIVALCRSEVLSVAELSARLRLPIGVIRVVASDLVVEGLLEAFLPSLGVAEDVDLISRLIEGVRAL
ncbi:MAG TPA: DUF742 domain-containing protein [Ilumatobacteraceae bacterium]|jgi:hypothetical protein